MPTFNHKPFNPTETPDDYNKRRKYRKNYQHLYNSKRWKTLRFKQLTKIPYCQHCYRNKQQYVYASVADHITDHHGNERLMWDEGNLQSLCKPCHDRKNGLTLNAKRRKKRPNSPQREVL